MNDLVDELVEWLRIPSISTGGGDPADLRRAAEWAADHVERAGGSAELVQIGDGNPLAIGDLRAATADAPTVLIYGHYDVQSVGDLSAWTLAAVRARGPRRPPVRARRLRRQGQLLAAAARRLRAGERGRAAGQRARRRRGRGGGGLARASPSGSAPTSAAPTPRSCSTPAWSTTQTPAITVGLRGMAMAQIEVRTGVRDLHSGMYGGSVLNALHVLHGMLAQVVPGPDGTLRDELRAGILAARRGRADRVGAAAARQPGALRGRRPRGVRGRGGRVLRAQRRRRLARHQPVRRRRAAHARARTSRTAPSRCGSRPASARPTSAPSSSGCCARARPPTPTSASSGTSPTRRCSSPTCRRSCWPRRRSSAPPARRPRSCARAARSRSSPSSRRARSPPSSSGFGLPDDDIHAPNESYRLESLELGSRTARELLISLADL